MSLLLALQGAGGYTLTADAGSYSVSGVAANLSRSYKITAEAGAYVVSGVSATVKRSKLVTGEAGAYSYSGSSAGITYVPSQVVVGRRFKTYRKGYLKRGHKVLVFNSQDEADAFEAAEIATAEAISRAQKKKARAEKPKPVETVNLERIEAQVVAWNIPDYMPMLVAELDIDYILALQRRIEQLQDDEDVELLLTL